MYDLIQVSYKVYELWGFSLTDNNRLDNCSANPYVSKWVGSQASGYVDMHMYAKCDKIYHEVQVLWTFLLKK